MATKGQKRCRGSLGAEELKLNTWVLVSPKTRRVRDRAEGETPALISAITPEFVTVLYPSPLVLCHGFRGSFLHRKQVPISDVRRYEGTREAMQAIEDKLHAAIVQAFCKDQQQKGQQQVKTDGKSKHNGDTEQALAQAMPAPCTPPTQASGVPRSPPSVHTPSHAEGHMPQMPSPVKKEEPPWSRDRINLFTKMVSQSFRELQGESPKRLVKKDMTSKLEPEFSVSETAKGLAVLEDQNKIMIWDELIFRV